MITSLHHIGCLVTDLTVAIADYQLLHPAGVASAIFEIPDQKAKVQFYSIGDTQVEFVQLVDDSSSLSQLLKKNAGYYHIGVYTDDITAEISRLEEAGYRLVNKFKSPAFEGHYCAFMYNLEYHLIELIEH